MDSVQLTALAAATTGVAGRSAVPAPPQGGAGSVSPGEAPARVVSPAPAPASAPAAVPNVNAPSHADAGREAVEDAVKQIKQFLKYSPANLEFTLDQASGRVLLRIIDSQTKELLLQVPSDEVLAIARALDRFKGLFVQEKA